MNQRPHLEWQLSLQGLIEGITPQQISVRDHLVNEFGFSHSTANAVIKGEISGEVSVAVTASERAEKAVDGFIKKLSSEELTSQQLLTRTGEKSLKEAKTEDDALRALVAIAINIRM